MTGPEADPPRPNCRHSQSPDRHTSHPLAGVTLTDVPLIREGALAQPQIAKDPLHPEILHPSVKTV